MIHRGSAQLARTRDKPNSNLALKRWFITRWRRGSTETRRWRPNYCAINRRDVCRPHFPAVSVEKWSD